MGAEKHVGEHVLTIHEDRGHLISTMNRADKAQLLQWIFRDLADVFPGIESLRRSVAASPALSELVYRFVHWFEFEASQ